MKAITLIDSSLAALLASALPLVHGLPVSSDSPSLDVPTDMHEFHRILATLEDTDGIHSSQRPDAAEPPSPVVSGFVRARDANMSAPVFKERSRHHRWPRLGRGNGYRAQSPAQVAPISPRAVPAPVEKKEVNGAWCVYTDKAFFKDYRIEIENWDFDSEGDCGALFRDEISSGQFDCRLHTRFRCWQEGDNMRIDVRESPLCRPSRVALSLNRAMGRSGDNMSWCGKDASLPSEDDSDNDDDDYGHCHFQYDEVSGKKELKKEWKKDQKGKQKMLKQELLDLKLKKAEKKKHFKKLEKKLQKQIREAEKQMKKVMKKDKKKGGYDHGHASQHEHGHHEHGQINVPNRIQLLKIMLDRLREKRTEVLGKLSCRIAEVKLRMKELKKMKGEKPMGAGMGPGPAEPSPPPPPQEKEMAEPKPVDVGMGPGPAEPPPPPPPQEKDMAEPKPKIIEFKPMPKAHKPEPMPVPTPAPVPVAKPAPKAPVKPAPRPVPNPPRKPISNPMAKPCPKAAIKPTPPKGVGPKVVPLTPVPKLTNKVVPYVPDKAHPHSHSYTPAPPKHSEAYGPETDAEKETQAPGHAHAFGYGPGSKMDVV